jgi:hypothetical protein
MAAQKRPCRGKADWLAVSTVGHRLIDQGRMDEQVTLLHDLTRVKSR